MEGNKKYILITGASSGIGRGIAVGLSKEYNLILNGRNEESLIAVLGLCENTTNHLNWVYDLNDVQGIERALETYISLHKANISVFIHCAGFLKMLPLKSLSLDNVQQTLNVNLNSAALIMKAGISRKVNNSCLENVVFISSTASIRGAKAFNIYSASKGALDALMRSLAVELAPKVRLNSILPGGVRTKMTEQMFDDSEVAEKMAGRYPLGLGEVADIFEMVHFLVSDKSKWITGQQFVVDGGQTINISA